MRMTSVARPETSNKQRGRLPGHPNAQALSEYPGVPRMELDPPRPNSPPRPATTPPHAETVYRAPPDSPRAKPVESPGSLDAANPHHQTSPFAIPPAPSERHKSLATSRLHKCADFPDPT